VTTQASNPATFPGCSRAVCRFAAHTSLAPHAAVKKDNRSYKGRQPKASHALKEEEQAELLLDSFFPQKKFNKRHAQTTTTTQFRIYTQNSQERKRRSRGFC
jgi:hypothetical protein